MRFPKDKVEDVESEPEKVPSAAVKLLVKLPVPVVIKFPIS